MNLDDELDKLLNIKTSGRDDSMSNFENFPYEATPYSVLQILASSGYITKRDRIVDFGCGKGRVDFFLAYSCKANMIGVEYDLRLYNSALNNYRNCKYSSKVEFVHANASDYVIGDSITGAYFFNPFSYCILVKVLESFKESKKRNDRCIYLYFYYPSREYLAVLNDDKNFTHIENLDCTHLFGNDSKEYIAIYKLWFKSFTLA